ncbi:MAG: hypothetical protein RLY45_73 [Actinomycetota bacterium]
MLNRQQSTLAATNYPPPTIRHQLADSAEA